MLHPSETFIIPHITVPNKFIYGLHMCFRSKIVAYSLLESLNQIKQHVAHDYVKLIMSIAKHHRYKNVDSADLLNEGTSGLLKALERFEPDRGYQFSTYATWWIHQGLNRVLNYGNSVLPIPLHIQRKIHKVLSTAKRLHILLGREPSIIEISTTLHISLSKVYHLLEIANFSSKLTSADQSFNLTDSRKIQHFLAVNLHSNDNEEDHHLILNDIFKRILQHLSPKETTLLRMRVGIVPYAGHTVLHVSKIFGVYRDKVRLLEKTFMFKIKHFFNSTSIR